MIHPGTHQPTNSLPLSDGIRRATHGYDTWESTNSALWPSKTPAQNYRKYRSWNDREVQFGTESKDVDESGICSPPLWTASLPGSPQHHKNHYRSLSPASRTQAIARGQRELMEMVRNMPESSYELSLKDLVEHHRVGGGVAQENKVEVRNLSNKDVYKREGSGSGSGSKKFDKRIQVKRSGNVDRGGFYLKMVFPTTFFGFTKKKKKNESSANNSSRVSPKPPASDGSVKGVDKEWWKKSLSASGESESGASSINSGSMKSTGSSSSNSSSSRCNSRHDRGGGGCWPSICRPKRLTQK